MSKIERYQGNLRAFASNAQGLERTVFGETTQADDLTSQVTQSFLRGWGIVGASEHPSLEDFNAAMYAMSQFIAYQHQVGVPEWHAEQEYYSGSICTHSGRSYQSLEDANVGNQPPSSQWTPILTAAEGEGRLLGVKVITSSGTYTPTAGTKSIVVECQGGGGAGGGSTATTAGNSSVGSGGSEGCYGKSLFTNLSSSYSVTIGSGGVSVSGGNGGAGGASSFGSLLTAGGGLGGGVLPSGSTSVLVGFTGLVAPTVTGANISSSTYAGTFAAGLRLNATIDIGSISGMGGRSMFGDGGGAHSSNGPGLAAVSYGAGGSGAKSWVNAGSDIAYAGGNGAKGVIIVWEYA